MRNDAFRAAQFSRQSAACAEPCTKNTTPRSCHHLTVHFPGPHIPTGAASYTSTQTPVKPNLVVRLDALSNMKRLLQHWLSSGSLRPLYLLRATSLHVEVRLAGAILPSRRGSASAFLTGYNPRVGVSLPGVRRGHLERCARRRRILCEG